MVATANTATGAADASMADIGINYIDPDDHLYRMVGGTRRDVLSFQHNRAQELSFSLWRANALAKRIIELEKDIITSGGFVVGSPDPALNDVIQAHWEHPCNAYDEYLPHYVRELALWGEQCYPASVNRINGQVLLGYIDPSNIKAVHKDPLNRKFEGKIILRSHVDEPEIEIEAIRYILDPTRKEHGRLAGNAFFFRVNSVLGATRGVPDLYPLIDWLDGYDRMLFDQLERVGLLNSFIWDVTLKGFNQTQVDDWVKRRRVPKSGSIRAHNENVEWTAVSPDLNSADTTESTKLIKRHILGGRSFPEHYFGEGGDANLATARAMDYPTEKTLESRQGEVAGMLTKILTFVRDQAILHHEIRANENTDVITVEPPPVSERDLTKVASSIQSTVTAFAVAKEQGWASDDQAIRIVCQFSEKFGVKVSPEEVKKALDEVPTADLKAYKDAANRARQKALKEDNGNTT